MSSLQERLQLIKTNSLERARVEHGYDTTEGNDPFAELKTDLHRVVIKSLGPRLFNIGASVDEGADLGVAVREALEEGLRDTPRPLSTHERGMLMQELTDDILAYGPITGFLRDESVSEVMVNSYSTIYIERSGKIVRTNARFVDEAHLERIIQKIVAEVGRRIDESSPMVDARLPDGSRVNAIIPPLAVSGSCLTIRKFREEPLTIDDLVNFGTLTPAAAKFLEMCVRGEANVLVSGGTGSGKTTTLNVLSAAVPADQRIITVEDAAELRLGQEHVITLESRPANIEGSGQVSIRDLVRNCLRMRPDRIIVGECRGGEAVDMLQAMNTGHDGSMTTVHANNPREALSRLETLVLMAGVDLPMRAIREQISGALDLVVQIERLVDGTRRVTAITEVGRLEQDMITLQDIFLARHEEQTTGTRGGASGASRLMGPLRMTGVKPSFLSKLASHGVSVPPSFFKESGDDLTKRRESRWILGDRDGEGSPTS